jgi:TRAP-type C4-dicarboxylate transport system permease small subunit
MADIADPVASPLDRWLAAFARTAALAGGALLLLLVLLTCASVIGRALFGMPVPGDFELVERGTAVAVFFCFPWCQWKGGHVAVDILAARLGRRVADALSRIGAAGFALLAIFLMWRLAAGGMQTLAYNDQSMVLGVPDWILYVAIWPILLLWALVAIRRAFVSPPSARDDDGPLHGRSVL